MHDPELSPEQEEQVRRLLAAARHDDPIPADVAARLDRVLVDLSRDEPDIEGTAPVVDLAARRRRRHAAALLAGAAAVIVGGFAVGQVIDVGAGDNGSGADSAAQEPVNRDQSDSGAAGGLAGSSSAAPEAEAHAFDAGPPMELTSENLRRDLSMQLPSAAAHDGAKASAPQVVESFGCPTAAASAYGTGRFFAAYYDGIPAVVALRPKSGDTRRADVLECATAAELASAVVAGRLW